MRGDNALLELVAGFTRVPIERLRLAAFTTYPKGVSVAELSEVIATMTRFGLGGRYPATPSLIHRTAAV